MSLTRWRRRLYNRLFLRRAFFGLHKRLFLLSLGGLGLLNYDDDRSASEDDLLRSLGKDTVQWVVFDVGAHQGEYSKKVTKWMPGATVYAFEPHPRAFAHLLSEASHHGFKAVNVACSDTSGSLTLYDYPAEMSGSEHASLYSEVFGDIHNTEPESWVVEAVTIDAFAKCNSITRIDFLKIDTEGNELKVLCGAQEMISQGAIPIIQFEFNEMNVISRVFFRDFYQALPGYAFYRMLPDGLVPLGDYNSLLCEIYTCQNIVAIRQDHSAPAIKA